jgi:hypothetical protein
LKKQAKTFTHQFSDSFSASLENSKIIQKCYILIDKNTIMACGKIIFNFLFKQQLLLISELKITLEEIILYLMIEIRFVRKILN